MEVRAAVTREKGRPPEVTKMKLDGPEAFEVMMRAMTSFEPGKLSDL